MPRLPHIALGAPGIYRLPAERPRPSLGVPMDVCAFVGVAPRGPARVPMEPEDWDGETPLVGPEQPRHRSVAVPVEGFDEYRRLFGGFDGPGRLPYAVASFFEQGGRKAYVVRIVAEYADPLQAQAGRSTGTLPNLLSPIGPVRLEARDEGRWGNRLRAALGFSSTPLPFDDWPDAASLSFGLDVDLSSGALLRLVFEPGIGQAPRLGRIANLELRGRADGPGQYQRVRLQQALPARPVLVELIEGDLLIDDGAEILEHFTGLGLSPDHPRWMASVLYKESELVYPAPDWIEHELTPAADLIPPLPPPRLDGPEATIFSGGRDRYGDIDHAAFFDSAWTPVEPLPGDGITAVAQLPDLATLVAPDLYVADPLPQLNREFNTGSLASAEFAPCAGTPASQPAHDENRPELPKLRLDPILPGDLDRIQVLQSHLVDFADTHRGLVVLLDVPPGLAHGRILSWRAGFDSSYAATYHPWLLISRADDARDEPIRLNPSAAAAGIIAAREIAFGVPHGPANELVAGAFALTDAVSPARHDQLHPLGINVLTRERDGIRLTAARSLSRDHHYRQLSVRRLMLMLRRALEQQMQWAVFEPNGPALWLEVRQLLRGYLRGLFRAGAFRGASEEQAFFVHCDERLNDRRNRDAGRMLAEVGVAPSEPLEFIVVRIARNGDGTLTLET